MSHYAVKVFFSSVVTLAFAAVAFAAPVVAEPPSAPGCVQDFGLPCVAPLPDLNAVCSRDPVACLFGYATLAGQLDSDSSEP